MSAVAAATEHVVAMLAASPEVRSLIPGGVQEGVADERAVMPYVLVQTYGDADDVAYNGGDRAFSRVELTVRVVMKALSMGTLLPLADAVDRALQASWGEYDNGRGEITYVTSCVRINETNLSELAAGRPVRYLGGVYELVVS